jgi:hypothetical protein
MEPKGVVSYKFPTDMNQLKSSKSLEARYLSPPSTKVGSAAGQLDSVPLDSVDFDALSLMPLGGATLLPEPEETILLYVATSIRAKYSTSYFGSGTDFDNSFGRILTTRICKQHFMAPKS